MVPVIASTGSHYVAAAYLVFVVLILIYVAITAAKVVRLERDLGKLAERVEERRR